MNASLSKLAAIRPCGLAAVLALNTLATTARAQETPAADPKDLIRRAYAKTDGLQTVEDAAEILRLLEQARSQPLSDELKDYVAELTAWTRNRRGEMYVEQAAGLAAEGQKEQADALDAKALNEFESALAENPDYWKAIHNVGVSRALEGDFETALQKFARVLELNPDYANAWFNRGEIRFEQGDYRAALADYTEAISREQAARSNGRGDLSLRIDARMRRALTLLELGRQDEAIRDFSTAVELEPQRADLRLVRGDAYRRMGRWQQAADDYRDAIRLDERLGRAYQAAAWLTATCPDPGFRNPDLSLQAAERAVQLEGADDYAALDALAAACASAGDFANAQKHIAAAIAAAPEDRQAELKARQALYAERQPYRETAATADE